MDLLDLRVISCAEEPHLLLALITATCPIAFATVLTLRDVTLFGRLAMRQEMASVSLETNVFQVITHMRSLIKPHQLMLYSDVIITVSTC